MESGMNNGNTMKYSDFTHLLFACVVLIACAGKGSAEPADQVNQREVNEAEKIQQKAGKNMQAYGHRNNYF